MEQHTLSDVGMVVQAMICALVDHPEQVRIDEVRGSMSIVLEVQVAPGDQGKVIGRRGRTIQAIRELLINFGARGQRRYVFNLLGQDTLRRLPTPMTERWTAPVSREEEPPAHRSRDTDRSIFDAVSSTVTVAGRVRRAAA